MLVICILLLLNICREYRIDEVHPFVLVYECVRNLVIKIEDKIIKPSTNVGPRERMIPINFKDKKNFSRVINYICKESIKRKERVIQRTKVENDVLQRLLQLPLFIAGSRADGSNDSASDVDLNYLIPNILVVNESDRTMTSNDKLILVLRQNNCHPGYCNLELRLVMHSIARTRRTCTNINAEACTEINTETCTSINTETQNFLSNSDFLDHAQTLVPLLFKNFGGSLRNLNNIHGPCVTPTHSFGKEDGSEIDLAFCIPCNHWPDDAKEWLERDRQYGWPGAELIERIKNYRCWFVPIGFSGKEDERVKEWRISFSIAERELMWSLSATQLLCIEFLKSFVSNKLESKYPNLLCSYFLKTIMFWIFEQSSANYWEPQNLTLCMKDTIKRLKETLITRECPHYFIKHNNLFAKKNDISLLEAGKLVSSFDIDEEIIHFIQKKSLFYKNNCIFQYHIMLNTVAISRHFLHGFFGNPLKCTFASVGELSTNMEEVDPTMIDQLKCSIASTVGSILLSECFDDFQKAKVYFEHGRKSDAMSGILKHATALFSIGDIDQALQILSELMDKDFSQLIHYSFYDRGFVREPDDSVYPPGDAMALQDVMTKYVALDVIFMPSEINIVPDFIKFQLMNQKPLFISPILYMYCLEFSCHMQKHDFNSMCQSYERFCNTRDLYPKAGIPHLDTDMKGYCNMMLGNYKQALKLLSTSVLSGDNYQTSLLLLSTLLHKHFKSKH